MSFCRETIRVARKDYICCECLHKIKSGIGYWDIVKSDGKEFSSKKVCLSCKMED